MGALDERRAAVAAAWNLSDEIVLVGAGQKLPVPGTDCFHEFRAHPEYRYLAGAEGARGVLAFDPREGWTSFVHLPTPEERVWHGGPVRAGTPLDQLESWLGARKGRPNAVLGCAVDGVRADEELTERLRGFVTAARRVKDAGEQEHLRAAAEATRAGFWAARLEAREGITERQLEVELEAAFLRAGGRRPAFDSIVAGGDNAAVLHFEPTDRALKEGELILIDAGAEVGGYACDCTRTFLVGQPSPEQRDLYQIVLEVQETALRKCIPGKEYREIHLEAQKHMARGLVDFGLLLGDVASLLERDAPALFWPHGIGHLVGLAVHDVGGYLEGRTRSDRPGLKWLRADLPLAAGHAVTIEPGLYFIDALLNDPARREEFGDAVDWARVDSLMGLGGVRIEDTVLVTDGEPEILTRLIPKGLVV